MIRSTVIFVTDLEVEPTKPIDAGMWKFCHVCGLCAEACPYGSLSFEKEPSWEPSGNYNAGGKKVFYIDYPQCMRHRNSECGCDNCMCACPFSKQEHANIHEIVKAVSATTSMFNGFFVNMDKFFNYGMDDRPDPESWWDLNMPAGGIDTCVGTLRLR
jgi:reductive dehalogenase